MNPLILKLLTTMQIYGIWILFHIGLVTAQTVLAEGNGNGTFYYDVTQDRINTWDLTSMNHNGVLRCGDRVAITPVQLHSNYLVAMNETELNGNLKKYCGKRVIVTYNGKKSNIPFFIGDGCAACAREPLLDFSFSGLAELSTRSEVWEKGRINIGWQIVNEDIYQFPINNSQCFE